MAASDHLHQVQFKNVNTGRVSDENGWMGPEGTYSMPAPAGSLYGYGVSTEWGSYAL